MPEVRLDDMLYRFANGPMPGAGIVAPGGVRTVKKHLEEGGYEGSNLFSMQKYVPRSAPAYFNYGGSKNAFGLGRTHVYLTALPVLQFALTVETFQSDDVPTAPANGALLAIDASAYHHHFHFNADQVPNTLEKIFCGTIPAKCFYVCTVEQFDEKAKAGAVIVIGWDLGFESLGDQALFFAKLKN